MGASVSRVGSAAQQKAMKQVAGTLKLDLAQYKEVQAFAQFASDLEASSQQLLTRGNALTSLLKQPQYAPLALEEQVALLFVGTKGYLDTMDPKAFERFSEEFLLSLRKDKAKILSTIAQEKKLSPETEKKLTQFVDSFLKGFV